MIELRASFYGTVQGVGFRYKVDKLARSFGFSGWVRNVGSNQVELVAQGDKNQLDVFLSEIKKWPLPVRIDRTEEAFFEIENRFNSFEIRRSS